MQRREFLGTSAAALVASRCAWALPPEHKLKAVGLQLYTVRSAMKGDFDGTVAKVAQVGYQEAEFAGYYDHSPKDIRALLDKNGLTSPSTHVDYDIVENKWSEQIEISHAIGHQYIVCPWIDEKQ